VVNSFGGTVDSKTMYIPGNSSYAFSNSDFAAAFGYVKNGYIRITSDKSVLYGLSLTFEKSGQIKNNLMF
jgi:hypothetical protein